jgi:membrane protein DedA with SNARE-associated domain
MCNWSFKKAIAFTLLGGMVKYGVIIALSGVFFAYFSSGTAQTVTIIMILVIIAASFVISLSRRRRMKKKNENSSC